MILSKENLNVFIEQSKVTNIEVIDGKLIAHKKYKVDVLTYILNKYSDIREIRFFWESSNSDVTVKNGVILGINIMIPFPIGSVTLKNNKIVISIDSFQFEDDDFNEYILKSNIDETKAGYKDNDLFGFVHVRSKTGPNIAILNVSKGGKSLNFNTDRYLETKNNITQFKIRNCYTSKNLFESDELEWFRMHYFSKIREIEESIGIYAASFELSIDLTTGIFKFHSKFFIQEEFQRKFLEYIYRHHRSLNQPIYSSIIGNAEEFLSERYQSTVSLVDKEMIKRYLDLDDMIKL